MALVTKLTAENKVCRVTALWAC